VSPEKRAPLETAEVVARDIGRIIKRAMPPGWGFFLLLSSFDEPPAGFWTYLASIEREGAIKFLREAADKIEKERPL